MLVVSRHGALWSLDLDSDDPSAYRIFSDAPGKELHPVVSRYGVLAFDRRDVFGRSVYIIPPDRAVRRLVTGSQPAFSPLGGRLAFVRQNGLYTVHVSSGSRLRRLTRRQGDRNPTWGSNGLIAFERRRGRSRGIFVVRPNGRGLRKLAGARAPLAAPRWSPDGDMLLVGVNANGGRCRTAKRRFDGDRLTVHMRLDYEATLTLANGCHPANAWSPGGAYAVSAGRHMVLVDEALEDGRLICGAGDSAGVTWTSSTVGGWLIPTGSTSRRWSGRCGSSTTERTTPCVGECGRRRRTSRTVCFHWHGKKVCVRI